MKDLKRFIALIMAFAMTLSVMAVQSFGADSTGRILGDVDGNGSVDEGDAALVLKHINGVSLITDEMTKLAADYTGNGNIDLLDAIAILNHKYTPPVTVALTSTDDYTTTDSTGSVGVIYQSATDDYLLSDTSTSAAAFWTNTFDAISSGVVTISGYATPSTPASKWAFVRAVGTDSNGSEVSFSFGTDTAKNLALGFTANGATSYTSTSTASAADTKYTYKLVIDLSSGSVTLTINGSTTLTGTTTATSISSIVSTTSVGSKRNLVVSKPVVTAGGSGTATAVTTTTTTTTTEATTIDTSDGKEVSNYSQLTSALNELNAKVYVTADISCDDQLKLSSGSQSIIGVPDENGKLPSLNFVNMTGTGKVLTQEKSGDGDAGISISAGSNTLKNLIIESARDNGVLIKGASAQDNTIENCILRYNNDSGMQITGGACNNTVKNVYSYRNCDVFTLGSNADGFAVKLGAGPSTASEMSSAKNTFENCYSWENSDDGWDSYDKETQSYWTYKNEYTDCMCWGNGSAAIQLGYSDYVNSRSLDENLPLIKRIKDSVSDSSAYTAFVTAFNSGNLGSRSMTESEFITAVNNNINVSLSWGIYSGNTISESGSDNVSTFCSKWKGNPNGFKMGSKYTQTASERTLSKCISFDHGSKGFDQNNDSSHKYKVYLSNCLSFDNGINYALNNTTAYQFDNVISCGTGSNNLPSAASGVTVALTKLSSSDATSAENNVRTAAETIRQSAYNNTFVDTGIFSTVFG